ncbi:MAG: ATP-binding protein [Vicinamibacterales bacterium]
MACPPLVRRALLRLGAGALAVLALVGVGGWLWVRATVGATPDATRARIEASARQQMARSTATLDAVVQDLTPSGEVVERAAGGDASSVGRLFAMVSVDGGVGHDAVSALTVYGPDGAPIAWDGRPSTLPASRLAGAATTFVLPSPLGLRLARLAPIVAGDGSRRRLGTVVAEVAISSGGATGGLAEWNTPLGPVAIGPPDGSGDPDTFEITTAEGARLGTARIAAGTIEVARAVARDRVVALLWLTAALALAASWGALATWRALIRSGRAYLAVNALMAAAAVASWAMGDRALHAWQGRTAPELRILLAALAALALASLLATVVARGIAVGVVRRAERRASRPVVMAAHLGAGALTAFLVLRHHAVVEAALALGGHPNGPLAVALAPFETSLATVAAGLVAVHAALALLMGTGVRAAVAPLTGRRQAFDRWGVAAALAGAAGVLALAVRGEALPGFLALAAGVLVVAAAFDAAARTLRRGSQPARLLVVLGALAVPSVAAYPSLARWVTSARQEAVVRDLARQVADQRQNLQQSVREALTQLWSGDIADLVQATPPTAAGPVPTDAAFLLWARTTLATERLTSSVELYDGDGRMVSRFALNLPETAVDRTWQESSCDWELFEEVSPFFAEERRLLHAGRAVCVDGRIVGSVVVHAVLDYANLPFLAAQNPYVALVGGESGAEPPMSDDVVFVAYGWSRRPLFVAGGDAWTLPEALLPRLVASRTPFWATLERQGVVSDVYFLSDRGAIYAIGYPRPSWLAHLSNLAEIMALTAVLFVVLLVATSLCGRLGGLSAVSGRALFRDVRASFSRTLFLAFVAAVVVPVVALALVTRAQMATTLRQDIEREATRTVLSASRVVEDFAAIEARGATNLPALDDSLLVWLSRVIGEDLNVFAGSGLLASSERTLFASGLLPTRTPGDTYRALVIEGQPTYLARESVGAYEYQVASALVRVADQQAIVSVPLTLRQRSIERQVDELDRRVLLAAIAFILLGSGIGYWAAHRISDPVSRLTRATGRLAAGDLDAHVLVRTSDELGRLVAAFNGMADDLRRQRTQLERTNRLEAWAEMARQVAHDIKNPLTPIQLNAEHLRRVHADRGQPLGALVDECVANILLQVRLLRQLASEFSSFASAPQARPAVTPLAPLLDEILTPYAHALTGRIAIETRGDTGVSVFVDPVLLARALTNVIENALHAMPGAGRLTVEVTAPGDGRARLDVVDTGVGMDAAALGRIFEPYFSTKATGTGLGLTIARRNVELNGGTIEVASTPGVGTTVSLWVPLGPPASAPGG